MRQIYISIFFIFFLCTVSCTKKSSTPHLVIAIENVPKTLDPRYGLGAVEQRLTQLLFNSLVRLGPELKIIGDAAKTWDYKNKTYTFILHKGLTFSNGRKLTKEDLLYSFEAYRNKKVPLRSILTPIENIKVEQLPTEEFQVSISLKEFSANFLIDLSLLKILPKKELIKLGEDFGENPIGTGSFFIKEKTQNTILLIAKKDHAFLVPKTTGVEIKIIKDDNTRYLKLRKGDLDIAQSQISASKVKFFENNQDYKVFKYPGPSMNYILVNLQDKLLKKHSIRKIINLSINRKEIIDFKLEGLGSPATSILPPNNPFHNKDLPLPEFKPDEAKTLIKKHNLKGSKLTLKTSNSREAIEIGRVIVNQLNTVGFDTEIQSLEFGTFLENLKLGNFQMAMSRWVGATDPDIYRIAYHTKELPPGRNRGRYSNSELDILLEKGLKIQDEMDRIQHYMKVQEIIYQDLPMIPLWYNTQVAIINKRVKNYTPPMNGDFSPLFYAEK